LSIAFTGQTYDEEKVKQTLAVLGITKAKRKDEA